MSRTVLRGMVLVSLAGVALPAVALAPPAHPRVAILAMSTSPQATPFPASHLGVRWHGSEDASVELRYSAMTGWAPWRRVSLDHDLDDEERGVHYAGLVRAPGATQVQLQAGPTVDHLEVVVIDALPGQTRSEPRQAPPERRPPEQPQVVTRAQWGADESMRKGPIEFAPLAKLVVHHTATQNDDPDPAATVRAIYAYHTQARGWNDIGYNFLVDATGRIYEGRFARPYGPGEIPTGEDEARRGVVGAHAKGANVGSVGVSLLGDFNAVRPSPAAVDALVNLLAWKASRHGIDPEGAAPYTFSDGTTGTFPNVAGHRDTGQTECPGDKLYALLPQIRQRVAALMPSQPPPAAAAPGAPNSPLPAPPPVPGFWTVSADGAVEAAGDAPSFGSASRSPQGAPVVGMATTPAGDGYWVVTADGQVSAFGGAQFFGSVTATPLANRIVRLAPTPKGDGYWLAQADGGVVPFGGARFYGAALPEPSLVIVGIAATPSGEGYWLAASDGRVFAFGDALTGGPVNGQPPTQVAGPAQSPAPIVSIAASPTRHGYWLVDRDGHVFAVDAPFRGNAPDGAGGGVVQIRATEHGDGYYLAGGDGAVFTFGDADQRRQRPGRPGSPPVVDMATRPLR